MGRFHRKLERNQSQPKAGQLSRIRPRRGAPSNDIEMSIFSVQPEKASQNQLHFEKFGLYKIYRPSPASDRAIRSKIEPLLKASFAPGLYTTKEDVSAILFKQVEIFGDRFDSLIPELASIGLLEFLLRQYDLSGKVDDLLGKETLTAQEADRWRALEPTYKRTLKYMAERITMLAPDSQTSETKMPSVKVLDEAFICAEELVNYCITADLSRIFPDHTTIKIGHENEPNYLEHEIHHPNFPLSFRAKFQQRISKNAQNRKQFYGDSYYFRDTKKTTDFLDEPMKEALGFSFTEVLQILRLLKENTRPAADNPMGTKFILKDRLIKGIADRLNKEFKVISLLLSGVCLTQDKLLERAKGDGDYWNPQFEERAYRKSFFTMPHKLGPHLAFGDRMLDEAFVFLVNEVAFGKFPSEWSTPAVKIAIEELGNDRGKWFEEQVLHFLNQIGIQGFASRKTIGQGMKNIALPGEFDFIGWSPKDRAIVLIEDKMMLGTTEAKFWQSQLNTFLVGSNKKEAYVPKLKKKAAWLRDNSTAVVAALKSEGVQITENPTKVLTSFMLFNPFALEDLIEFPCPTLPEFVESFTNNGSWPYEKGVVTIDA